MDNNFKKIALIATITSIVLALMIILVVLPDSRSKNKLLSEMISIQKYDKIKADDFKQDFINKCLMARQVYQFSWYNVRQTKVGPLNLDKQYAMSLYEYNELVNLSWDLNRQLGIPLEAWQNYIMLAKWIMESGIWENAQHETGEIIAFAGYTEEGMYSALSIYKFESHINEGSPFYVKELFTAQSKDDLMRAFKNLFNVVRFDYGFASWLLSQYDYQWDWMLTGFHFGFDKTDYWKSLGLKSIPEFRLDGRWKEEYIREYYQAVFEIAQGISMGYLRRMSRYEKVIGLSKRAMNRQDKFIETLRLKVKSEQKFAELDHKYKDLSSSFSNYREVNDRMYRKMAELNDMNLDADCKSMKDQLHELKKSIQKLYAESHR